MKRAEARSEKAEGRRRTAGYPFNTFRVSGRKCRRRWEGVGNLLALAFFVVAVVAAIGDDEVVLKTDTHDVAGFYH